MNKKKLMEEAVRRFAGSQVLNMIKSKGASAFRPGWVSAEGFILCADIAGFAELSERRSLQDLVALLNNSLDQVMTAIDDQDGEVVDIVGDSVLACWEGMNEESARKVCNAAVEIARLQSNRRIGVTGGSFMRVFQGSSIRLKYSILGDSVNLAYHLCSINRQYGTRLLIDEVLFNMAHKGFLCRTMDKVRVIGRSTPFSVFELLVPVSQITEKQQKLYTLFSEALDHFVQKDWKVAAQMFESILEHFDDPVSNVYLQRSKRYLKKPPQADWDGVYEHTQK